MAGLKGSPPLLQSLEELPTRKRPGLRELILVTEGGDWPGKGLAGETHFYSIQLRWAELGK